MNFPKSSIVISAIILALGGGVAWQNSKHLQTTQMAQNKLVAKLESFGVDFDQTNSDKSIRIAKRERASRVIGPHKSIADQVAVKHESVLTLAEIRAVDLNDGNSAGLVKSEALELRLRSLSLGGWKTLLSEIEANKDLKEWDKQNSLTHMFVKVMGEWSLNSASPENLLLLAREFPNLFKDCFTFSYGLNAGLKLWIKRNPLETAAWFEKNIAAFPDIRNRDPVIHNLMTTVASQDPSRALQLLDELDVADVGGFAGLMAYRAESAENRTAILLALRNYRSSTAAKDRREDAWRSGVAGLVQSAIRQGFESGSDWIDDAGLTPDELAYAAGSSADDLSAPWLDWLVPRFPSETAPETVEKILNTWVEEDHKAVSEWIGHTAEGPVKDAAIHTFAVSVAAHEPATAVQWAITLPPGDGLQNTLKGIYGNWQKSDTAGREAFGKLHGFE